jgi:predicted PurR-regulated permease PerM
VPSLAERSTLLRRRLSGDSSHLLFALAVAVVFVATLYFARVVIVPVTLAVLFTFLLTPVVSLLERIRLPRTASALLVVLLGVAAVGAFGWMVAKQFVNVTEQFPNYATNIQQKIASLRNSRGSRLAKATDTVRELGSEIEEGSAATAGTPAAPLANPQNARSKASQASASTSQKNSKPSPGDAGTAANPVPVKVVSPPANSMDSLPSVLDAVATAGIVIVFTFFMLLQREDLRNRFIRLAGQGRLKVMTQALDEAAQRVSRYLLLQSLVNVSYGVIIGVALYFLKIPNALLWGAIAGTLRFLPYIGPPLGAFFPVALSLAVFNGWSRPLMTAGVFICLEIVVSNFVEPLLYGAQTGVTSIGILFAAVFWTTLWGPVGLLLSTPLTVCLVVMGRHVPFLSFLQIMLGDEPVLPPEARFYQRLLAMDQDEARRILEQDFKDMCLGDLYDSVIVRALSLAEQDRHRDMLDETTEKFIFQSTKELLDEQLERCSPQNGTPQNGSAYDEAAEAPHESGGQPAPPKCAEDRAPRQVGKILCLPARDEADEIVGIMLTQLLERDGYLAQCLSPASTNEMLEQVALEKPEIVCISALPPFAVAHARTLYRKLRERWPALTILTGLWQFSGDADKIAARMGIGKNGTVCAALSDVMHEITEINREKTASLNEHPAEMVKVGQSLAVEKVSR